jgi:cytochrome c-type biogenesis protein
MTLSGGPVDYLFAFLGGILVSFTPCVYPLIPISIGYIGIRASGSKLKGLTLSLVYVTGIAVTYSILGILASLTGTIFGRVSSSPFTYIMVGCIIILFGMSILGLFVIPLPNIVKLPALKKQSYFSTFLLGLSSGLIASPCLTPVLGTILLYLTTKKNILYGATLLFTFAYGMGFILILAGTFSSLLVNAPKSGKWMLNIKRFSSLILIAMGIYFIYMGLRRL